jgi:hypothetical protein
MGMILPVTPPKKNKIQHLLDKYYHSPEGSLVPSSVGDTWGRDNGRVVQGGRAYDFDGVDDYVDYGDILNFNNQSFSAGCWFNTTETTAFRLLQKRGTGLAAKGWQISLTPDVHTDWRNTVIDDGTNLLQFDTVSINENDGQWHHVFLTFDAAAGTGKLYIDGVLKGEKTNVNLVGADLTTTRKLTFGNAWDSDTSTSQYFDGNAFDARIYSKVLSASEINGLYNFNEINKLELKLRGLFDDTGNISYDSSGNNNHGNKINIDPVTFNYKGLGIPYSYLDTIGYTLSDGAAYYLDLAATTLIPKGELIPRDESDVTKCVAYLAGGTKAPLLYKGQVAYDGHLVESNCLSFDNVDDEITTSSRFDFIHETGIFEIEFYCNFLNRNDATYADTVLQTKWVDLDRGIRISYANKSTTGIPHNTLYVITTTTQYVVYSDSFDTGEVQHFRIVGDGSKIKIYRNDTDVTVESPENTSVSMVLEAVYNKR